MYEELFPDIYRIRVPLPGNPLKEINSYVILSKTRNLVIDTGLNRQECVEALSKGFSEIGLDIEKTDLFLTHMHGDHIGLAGWFKTAGSSIFCSETDGILVTQPETQWPVLKKLSQPHGFFTNEEADAAIAAHPANKYPPDKIEAVTTVKDGDCIKAGDYTLQCIATPGHTSGHVCLYDPVSKILFAGDHILGDITPNISQWRLEDTNLADYLGSLDKIAAFDVRLVLPGHRSMVADCRARIQQLKQHHDQRNNEILDALKGSEPLSAYQVASRISWNINKPSWELFPIAQKWFATGETVAHLCFLRDKGAVKMIAGQNKVEWIRLF